MFDFIWYFGNRKESKWVGSDFEIEMLDSQPGKPNMDPVSNFFDEFRLSKQLRRSRSSLFGVFVDVGLLSSDSPDGRSGPANRGLSSFADSWWYHLGEFIL